MPILRTARNLAVLVILTMAALAFTPRPTAAQTCEPWGRTGAANILEIANAAAVCVDFAIPVATGRLTACIVRRRSNAAARFASTTAANYERLALPGMGRGNVGPPFPVGIPSFPGQQT